MTRIVFIFLTLFCSVAWAESLYVHSAKAPLFEQPAFNSLQLVVLPKGAELTVVQTEKRWVEVIYSQQQGWVSTLLVKPNPPLDQVNLIGSDSVTLEGEARRRASAVATAGATRGLTDSDDADGLSSDYQELNQMESLLIPLETLDGFASELYEE